MTNSKYWLITLLLCCVTFTLLSQSYSYKFNHLDNSQGLSHNRVNCFLQDSKGFIWVGTISGLNRFDGYNFKIFRHSSRDSSSISDNNILKMMEGPEGRIWITTDKEVNIYNQLTETFERGVDNALRRYGMPPGKIVDIVKDTAGGFWFLHDTEGVFRHDTKTNKAVKITFESKLYQPSVSSQMVRMVANSNGGFWAMYKDGVLEKINSSNQVIDRIDLLKDRISDATDFSMTIDREGDLWFFTGLSPDGVYFVNTTEHQIQHFGKNSSLVKLNTDIIRSIVVDNNGLIWIATDHGGINIVDKHNWQVQYVMNDSEDAESLSQNSIDVLYKDNEGIIWIGTFKKGIDQYHENIKKFRLYRRSSGLTYNDVNRFVEDDKGNLWIGTNGGGLLYLDRNSGKITTYKNDPGNPSSLSNNVIVSLWIDHSKKLWIGTYFGGLNQFNGKSFINYRHKDNDAGSISDDRIWEIFEDSGNHLWIGTLGNGLDLHNPISNTFSHYKMNDVNSIHSNAIYALIEDRQKNIWIGTNRGVDVLEKATGRFVHYESDQSGNSGLSHNGVLTILEDSRGLIWIGTLDGLNLFDPKDKSFRAFHESNGLPHNTILTILEDNEKNLWISTPNGLSNLKVKEDNGLKYEFKNYDEQDGLQGKEFNENAALKTKAGELIFGGANGFNIFRPQDISLNKRAPRVSLTGFQVFNRELKVGELLGNRVVLDKNISEMKEVTLRYDENVFSVEFAALSFIHPQKNKYLYKLEGFDKDWVPADGRSRKVTYTNLNPGDYVFSVKASNSDGFWNQEGTHLKIHILPPFWRTNIAIGVYVVVILLALVLARQLILQRERMKAQMVQGEREAQRLHELDMLKIKFFTNVSHEFRTPLTLILTPLEKLLKNATDQEHKSQFQLIQRNAKRLLNLVNQLLDFRRMEVQEINYNPVEGDIVQFIKEITYSFSDLSEKKNIQFRFETTVEQLETFFDQDKLERILFNLLFNAFKFTPEGGEVSVIVNVMDRDSSEKFLEIRVKDSGIGIPKEKHDKIFERFFQNDLPGAYVNQGSGIGLSITKEFVKIHGGEISVESEPGKGTCFTLLLPLKEIINSVVAPVPIVENYGESNNYHLEENHSDSKPVVVIVDDNEDFRFYLKDNLKSYFNIVEAKNGREGIELVIQAAPDLVVSDVMMPEINGIDLCKKIKNDYRTSHIPVILLTARASDEQKLEGFSAGANDYITKPFSFEILHYRIKNLIIQQENVRKALHKQLIEIKPHDIEIVSLDSKLLQKAMEVVEKNISNADFSVEELSHELNMSRVHLYKKITSLTGKSPIEFIRIIRLKRAAQLLEKSQLTVSEIAYEVGFNNPKYFTRYFKSFFKVLPSLYASSKKEPLH